MFSTKVSADSKSELLNKSRNERERRELDKRYAAAVITIQKHIRRYLSNKRLLEEYLQRLNSLQASCTAVEMLETFKRVLFVQQRFKCSQQRSATLCTMCRTILRGMETGHRDRWYVALAVSKSYKAWLAQVTALLTWTLEDIQLCDISRSEDKERVGTYLTLYILLCDSSMWKLQGNDLVLNVLKKFSGTFYSHLISGGLLKTLKNLLQDNASKTEPLLPASSLSLLSQLVILSFKKSSFSESIWLAMWLSVFATPCLVARLSPSHLKILSQDVLTALVALTVHCDVVLKTCTKEELLFVLLNCIQLLYQALKDGLVVKYPTIIGTFRKLLIALSFSSERASNWHPLLGMYSDASVSPHLNNSLKQLSTQIGMIHSQHFKQLFFQDLLEAELSSSDSTPRVLGNTWKHLFSSRDSKLLLHVSDVCSLYNTVIKTFRLHRKDILMSLCCFPDLLSSLWKLVYSEHSQSSRALARNMASEHTSDPFVPLLLLFSSAFSQYFVVLSDPEIYEQEQPFTLKELATIGDFVNCMLFNIVWNHYDDLKTSTVLDRVSTCHNLVMLLHERDERRRYTSNKFWTPKDASPSSIIAELKTGKGRAHKVADYIPWVLPNKKKLEYLQDVIRQDKLAQRAEDRHGFESRTVLVKIHRKRLFEDGFQQLNTVPDQILKHNLKIMFVNELGLDEVGIDQDGVLKEFLEETIRYALNPSFGLFAVTEENHWLYPSPLSKIHFEHLELFHYIGRILAKAVYEGIVVDLSFAPFFIRQLLQNKNTLFSYFDELPSLDAELHKNLLFIKTYEGDVSDLGLTFSVDENEFGKVVTEELMPGGSYTAVTNTNKMSYIFQMAHFKMHTQIHKQTRAFTSGFRSIISDEWLRMFSFPELQMLVSGDSTPVDFSDLKKNVRYLGGYHGGHRVILWFWDITINEFTDQEKSSLLKFVTSCSRPPLMGFASLSPPFSIRAVDEEEECNEQTPGQALKSSFKSFLGLQAGSSSGTSRLPTASTCFNLLKLPVYRSKQNLRQKLKYAINAGAGFELS